MKHFSKNKAYFWAVVLLFWQFHTLSLLWAQERAGSAEAEFEREMEEFLNDEPLPKAKDRKQGTLVDWANLPRIFVATDMLGDWNLGKAKEKESDQSQGRQAASDSADVREVEFGFSTAIDQWAEGTVLFAVHNEGGEYFVELHEAYFEFNQLPWNFFFKLGKFFMDIGRLNGIHRHDWKFSQAPLIHEEFFDEEAVDDFGGELSYLAPLPFYQEIKLGVFNGRRFGHVHDEGEKKPNPLITGRIKNFFLLPNHIGTQVGWTYLRYNVDDDPGNYWQIGGMDLTFKRQRGRLQNLEWSSEFWYRRQKFANGSDDENRYGYYSFIEYQLGPLWSLGLRFDHFVRLNDFDGSLEKEIDKNNYGQSLWLTLRASEFSYLRWTLKRQDFYAREDEYLFLAQAQFILGYHPPHKY